MITPVAFGSIKHHTYTVFAVINAVMVPSVYFFFPETAYRSLEEMDGIFQQVTGLKGALDVVHVARNEPHHYNKNGELIEDVDGEKGGATHGNGSSSDASGHNNNAVLQGTNDETLRPSEK